jgi:hypothetical protein
MSQKINPEDIVSGSSIAYMLDEFGDETTTRIVNYFSIISQYLTSNESDRMAFENAIRIALGAPRVHEKFLERGKLAQTRIDDIVTGRAETHARYDGVKRIYTAALAQALANRDGRSAPTDKHWKAAIDTVKAHPRSEEWYASRILTEHQLREALQKHSLETGGTVRFENDAKADLLIRLDKADFAHDGKETLMITDAKLLSKGLSVAGGTKYLAQTATYHERLSGKYKGADVWGDGSKLADYHMMSAIIDARYATTGVKSGKDAGTVSVMGSGDAATVLAKARRELLRIHGAASALGQTQQFNLPGFVHTALTDGVLSQDQVNQLLEFAKRVRANVDAPVQTLVLPDAHKAVELSARSKRERARVGATKPPERYLAIDPRLAIIEDEENFAIIGNHKQVFANQADLLKAVSEPGVPVTHVGLVKPTAGYVANLLAALEMGNKRITRDVTYGHSDVLGKHVGQRIERASFDGVTLTRGDQIAPGVFVDHLRLYGDNDATVIAHHGGEVRAVRIEKVRGEWFFDGQAAIPVLMADKLGDDAVRATLDVGKTFTESLAGAFGSRARGSEKRSVVDKYMMTRLTNIEDLPMTAIIQQQRSVMLTGFAAMGEKGIPVDARYLYWVRDRAQFAEKDHATRVLRTDAAEFLSAIPGLVQMEDGRYWTGRSPEKAVKLAKDLQKTMRPRHGFRSPMHWGETPEGTNFRVNVLGTAAFTQGMGYMILPEGADPSEFGVHSRQRRDFVVPDGFEWDQEAISGASLKVTNKGVLIGTRRSLDEDGNEKRENVYLPLSRGTYENARLDFSHFQTFDPFKFFAGQRIRIGVDAFSPQFSIKHGDIKAYVRTMGWGEAVKYFGEDAAKKFIGDGKAPALVVGHGEVKTLPLFLEDIARARGTSLKAMFGDSPDAQKIFEQLQGAEAWFESGKVQLDTPKGYAGLLEEGGVMNVPFIATRAMLHGTAESRTGRTRLNAEELNFAKLYYPDMHKDIMRHARGQRETRGTAILAAAVARGETDMPTDFLTITRAQISAARQGLPDTAESYGDVLRRLAKEAGADRWKPLMIEGSGDLLLPSIQTLAQISTTGVTGKEINPLIKQVWSAFAGIPGKRATERIHEELFKFTDAPATKVEALSSRLRGAVMSPFALHTKMKEGTVFIPPEDLIRMIPGLAAAYRSVGSDVEKQTALTQNIYRMLEGEVVTFFRRPATDPLWSILPMTFANPFKDKGLADIAKALYDNPRGRPGMMIQTSDAVIEAASADFDKDTALYKLFREINVRRGKGGAGYILTKRGGGTERDKYLDITGSQHYTPGHAKEAEERLIKGWVDADILPKGVGNIKDALRAITLMRARDRGATIEPDALSNLSDNNAFGRNVRLIAQSQYPGSQLGAIQADNEKVDRAAEPLRAMMRAIGMPEDVEGVKATTMSLGDISRGTLEQVRGKVSMGPTYTNLRVMMGAFQNRLEREGQMTPELWKAYSDIARTYSRFYQEAVDLKAPSDRVQEVLSRLYTSVYGTSYFNPFTKTRVSGPDAGRKGMDAVGRINWLLKREGIGALESDLAKETLVQMIGTLGGEYTRRIFSGITDPDVALDSLDDYRGAAADLLTIGAGGGKLFVDWKEAYDVMDSVVTSTIKSLFVNLRRSAWDPNREHYPGLEYMENPVLRKGKPKHVKVEGLEYELLSQLEQDPESSELLKEWLMGAKGIGEVRAEKIVSGPHGSLTELITAITGAGITGVSQHTAEIIAAYYQEQKAGLEKERATVVPKKSTTVAAKAVDTFGAPVERLVGQQQSGAPLDNSAEAAPRAHRENLRNRQWKTLAVRGSGYYGGMSRPKYDDFYDYIQSGGELSATGEGVERSPYGSALNWLSTRTPTSDPTMPQGDDQGYIPDGRALWIRLSSARLRREVQRFCRRVYQAASYGA